MEVQNLTLIYFCNCNGLNFIGTRSLFTSQATLPQPESKIEVRVGPRTIFVKKMVLQGFSSGTYIGWITGILFIKNPQGIPIIPPKRSLYMAYAGVVDIVLFAIWVDFHIRHIRLLEKESMVDRFLSCSLLFGASAFDIYFRVCFFTRSKLIARFLKSLEADYEKIPGIRIPSDEKKSWKRYSSLLRFVNFYHYLGAVITALWIAVLIPEGTNIFGFISSTVYPVIFLIFGAIPLISSAFVSIAFVVTTTFHLLWIFEDFCIYFEEQINLHEKQTINPMKRDLGEIYSIHSKSGFNDQILSKFEHLKLLCSQYDKIAGPLLLGLLVRAVFILISSANTILLFNGTGTEKRMKFFLNIYHFVTEMSQLVLLQLGYMVRSRIEDRKEELHRKVILMSNLTIKDQFKDAVGIVSEWNWSVSGGPKFFEVDRPLLSGVLSSLMTYVTILFQLNVADEMSDFMDSVTNTTSIV